MADNGSKGNPAGKRMMNPKLKEKRARSWARGQKRKLARRQAEAALMKENMALLDSLGGTRMMRDRLLKSGRTVQKLESPSEALRRVYRTRTESAA